MKFSIFSIVCCQILALSFSYLQLQIKMEERQNSICFMVGSPSDINMYSTFPQVALVLQVSYPLTIGEAGQIVLKNLTIGQHQLTYNYIVTNMTHDLQVFLDGVEKKFFKSEIPRLYSVSTFHEVSIMTQGNVKMGCQESRTTAAQINSNKKNTINDNSHRNDSRILSNNSQWNVSENRSISSNSGEDIPILNTTEYNSTSKLNSNRVQNDSKSVSESSKIDGQEYVTLISPSYLDLNSIRTEGSAQCLNGENCDHSADEYTIVYVLVGILGGLMFFAIVISLVFHKKKKKYLPDRPKNRMHQLYESANLTGESRVTVDQLTENIQEQSRSN